MNERIGNNKIYILAKEAGLIEFEQFAWNPELESPTYESVVKSRKFAELIVKECAKVANPLSSYADLDAYKLGRRWASTDILNHFGVKE